MNPLKKYKDKIIVLSSKKCPACKTLKIRVEKDQIMKDKFVFLDVEEDELAQILADVFDIRSVPSYVSVEVKKKKIYVCKFDKDMRKIEACYEVGEG